MAISSGHNVLPITADGAVLYILDMTMMRQRKHTLTCENLVLQISSALKSPEPDDAMMLAEMVPQLPKSEE